MKISIEEKKIEALERLEILVDQLRFSPSFYKYFDNDAVFYSYLVKGSRVTKIENLIFNADYQQKVEAFENEHNALVYHVIETANDLIFLYVGDDIEQWNEERLDDENALTVYILDCDSQNYTGFVMLKLQAVSGLLCVSND